MEVRLRSSELNWPQNGYGYATVREGAYNYDAVSWRVVLLDLPMYLFRVSVFYHTHYNRPEWVCTACMYNQLPVSYYGSGSAKGLGGRLQYFQHPEHSYMLKAYYLLYWSLQLGPSVCQLSIEIPGLVKVVFLVLPRLPLTVQRTVCYGSDDNGEATTQLEWSWSGILLNCAWAAFAHVLPPFSPTYTEGCTKF